MNRKLFSEIRKSCKTKSQRLAFNRLVKSFADYEPFDISRYIEEMPHKLDSVYKEIKEVFNHNNWDNSFDSACKEYKIFEGKQINPIIDIKDNNIIISIGDLKGVVSIYASYKPVPGAPVGDPHSRYLNKLRMELRLNKQLPEEFIERLKREGYISAYKGKRDPKFICPVNTYIESPAIRGARIIKWAYAYFINNGILNYFNRYK